MLTIVDKTAVPSRMLDEYLVYYTPGGGIYVNSTKVLSFDPSPGDINNLVEVLGDNHEYSVTLANECHLVILKKLFDKLERVKEHPNIPEFHRAIKTVLDSSSHIIDQMGVIVKSINSFFSNRRAVITIFNLSNHYKEEKLYFVYPIALYNILPFENKLDEEAADSDTYTGKIVFTDKDKTHYISFRTYDNTFNAVIDAFQEEYNIFDITNKILDEGVITSVMPESDLNYIEVIESIYKGWGDIDKFFESYTNIRAAIEGEKWFVSTTENHEVTTIYVPL